MLGSDEKGRVDIQEAILKVRTVSLNPDAALHLNNSMKSPP